MKTIIRILSLVLALVVTSFSLVGCLLPPEEERYAEDRNIRYIGYTCAAPSDADSFSFTIKEAEDGTVEFTAWCTSEDGEKIVLTGVTVGNSELDAVREIAEKHYLSDFLMADDSTDVTERDDISPDETLYTLLVMWKNGDAHQTNSAYPAADDLRAFFFGLAERTAKEK